MSPEQRTGSPPYARSDQYLKELWTWLQADPEYRGRTHILITTDHGRGHTIKDWRNHGATVEGAQHVWMAFVSPTMPTRGEWPARWSPSSLAGLMGLDWKALRSSAGAPIRGN